MITITLYQFSSVQSLSRVRLFATPHESQHARPPCPSPTPGVHSNSCPSSRWCRPAISSSVVPVCKTAKETQMYRTVFWTLWERARVGWFGRIALKHVYYHRWNGSPVQVWYMRQDAQGWCTGMTLRDAMGREVEGRVRMQNICTPTADSCECRAKTTTIL